MLFTILCTKRKTKLVNISRVIGRFVVPLWSLSLVLCNSNPAFLLLFNNVIETETVRSDFVIIIWKIKFGNCDIKGVRPFVTNHQHARFALWLDSTKIFLSLYQGKKGRLIAFWFHSNEIQLKWAYLPFLSMSWSFFLI